MIRKFLALALATVTVLSSTVTVFAEETTPVTLNNSNGGVGTVQSDVNANVSTSFNVKVPATISLNNKNGYCIYDGTNVVGIQGDLQHNRAVSMQPALDTVVLSTGSGEDAATTSVPVTQDQIVWNRSDLSDGAMHYTNLHIKGVLDPGNWSGKLTFQIKINDTSACATGHAYDNHVCTRCGALEGGLYSLQREFRKSWNDLAAPDGVVNVTTANDGTKTAIIDDGRLTYQNILVVPGDVDYVGCSGSSQTTGAITNLVLMDGVKGIKESGFANRSGLKSVTIPGSVKTISQFAFDGCSGLSSLTLGDGIEKIEPAAFCRCSSLKNFTMPRSVTRLGNVAFSPTSSGTGPFENSDGLCITYTGTKDEWKALKNDGGGSLNFSTGSYSWRYAVKCTDGTLTYSNSNIPAQT